MSELKSKCCGAEIEIEIRNVVPKNEIWFCHGLEIVGKIINIEEPPPRGRRKSGEE